MLYTCSQVQWRRRPTTVVAVLVLVLLIGISAAQNLLQTPLKSGLTVSDSPIYQNKINYFTVNEANSPLAVLDILEATMKIYHDNQSHFRSSSQNDNTSFTMGVKLVVLSENQSSNDYTFPPNRLRPAYSMQGTTRQLRVPDIVYKRAVQLLRDADELTIAAIVRQERTNTGSIVSFSLDSNRYLELESSGRKDEVRLHYVAQGTRRIHTEVFAYALADDHWHAVAVTLSGAQVRLYVDCRLIYTRTLANGPVETSFTGSPDLYVGQRNKGVHSVFKGILQDVQLIRGVDGQRVQCPNLDSLCPTCGQFNAMQKTMDTLYGIVHIMSVQLEAALKRIAELEACECRKPCVQFDERSNQTWMKPDGSVWQHDCETCTCLRGQVECSPVRCPPVECKYPIRKPGECCETCQKPCQTKGDIVFEHGSSINLEPCLTCVCLNGVVKCEKVDVDTQCPVLECPPSEQFSVPDECCKFCPGVDYCARGGRDSCHPNATCINLKTTHKCACATGYVGTGLQCDDVDECSSIGGQNGHHCDANTTVCVNTPGSYTCQCLTGYARLNRFECADVDECGDEERPCHLHATCTNSPGSYSCKCADGYEGDGYTCRPVCQQKCLNGGVCSRPNECTCPNAFEGPACERDVDECATGNHECLGPSSRCVNMAGWYYCACSPGYQNVITYSSAADNTATVTAGGLNVLEPTWAPLTGTMCQDVDECLTNNHTCHPSTTCVNSDGSYECKCSKNAVGDVIPGCKSSCLLRNGGNVTTEVDDGTSWLVEERCANCSCAAGRLQCSPIVCDCANNDYARSVCCGHCNEQASCAHQELANVRFLSGQQWIYQCQTCECLMGQVDCWPMQCPPTLPPGSGCADRSIADYNDPVTDCCAPRCGQVESANPSATAATTAMTATVDPCAQHQRELDKYAAAHDNNNDPVDLCRSCDCKDGLLLCSYNVHHCNNSAVATTTGHPDGKDVNDNLSRQPHQISNANGTSSESTDTQLQAAVSRRNGRRRRQATMVDDNSSNNRDYVSVNPDEYVNFNVNINFNKKDWWWRKTRRRKRSRPHGTGRRRYQIISDNGEEHFNSNNNFIDNYNVNTKNEDNNVNNNNNNNDNDNLNNHQDRIVVKTVVVT